MPARGLALALRFLGLFVLLYELREDSKGDTYALHSVTAETGGARTALCSENEIPRPRSDREPPGGFPPLATPVHPQVHGLSGGCSSRWFCF